MSNIFDIINIPIGYVIKFCYMIIPNYAITLLLFAIIIKVLLFPLSIKQQKNMVKQASMRPKEMAIRKKYAGRTDKVTQQKLNEEIMQFYQRENYNPAGGCLPLLIQLPILFAVYNVVTNPLRFICNFSTDVLSALSERITALMTEGTLIVEGLSTSLVDKLTKGTALTGIELTNVVNNGNFNSLSSLLPEGFAESQIPDFHTLGLDLSMVPSINPINILIIIPIVTFVVSFLSMRITRKMTYQPPTAEQSGMSMKMMDYMMPAMSVFIAFSVPAVVGVYWIYQNILSAVQQYILKLMYPIPVFSDEDYKAAEREMNGTKSKKEKKKVRSLHRIDEEDEDEAADSRKSDKPPLSTQDAKKLVAAAPIKDDDREYAGKNKKQTSDPDGDATGADGDTDTDESDN